MADLGRQLADLLYGESQQPKETTGQKIARRLTGAGETAATIGTGLLGSVPAGLAGLSQLIPTRGRAPDVNRAAQKVEDVQGSLTYLPRTETGQRYLQNTAGALETLGAPAEYLGEKVLQYTGSPAAATFTNVILDPVNAVGLPGSGKAAVAATKAAGRAAMAAPRVAGDILSEALMPASRAQAERGAIAWHGTPHEFAPEPELPLGRFRAEKIGSGEGAQSYGHGIYLAESPGVAKSYKNALANTLDVKGEAPAIEKRAAQMALTFGDNTTEGAIKWLEKYEGKGAEHTIPALTPELIEQVKSKFLSGTFSPGGSLYKVDLPDSMIEKMLDWDKPLDQQPQIKKLLEETDYRVGISEKEAEKIADDRVRAEAYDWADETGGDWVDFYNNANWDKYIEQVKREFGGIDSSLTGKDLHALIMKDEGYRPELFDDFNYQVGTSELLRGLGIPGVKYLDRSSRGAGEGTRNFVVFPGEEAKVKILERNPEKTKKSGGSVRISDNPDTMALELASGGAVGQERSIGSKLVGGGVRGAGMRAIFGMDLPEDATKAEREVYANVTAMSNTPGPWALAAAPAALVKGAKGAKAVKAAKEEKLSVPYNIPRAPAKTKEEIRPIAQRMAEQMTGEFVRPDLKISKNPAGKTYQQFLMERELEGHHQYRKTKDVPEPEVADIEKQEGMVKFGISGDTTMADTELLRAGPYQMEDPVPLHGGPRFPLGGEGAWASNNPIAANVQRRIGEMSQFFDAPVLGQYMAMGPSGSMFAQHLADANLQAIDLSKMSKRQIEQFNKLIREGNEKSGPRPTFPGIQDKNEAYLWMAFDPKLRIHFNELMQKPTVTGALNLPDGRIILDAITEPELRNKEIMTSGLSQFQFDPNVRPEDLSLSMHPTYTHLIPMRQGAPVTRTRYPTPAELEFPDVTNFIRQNYRPQDFVPTFQKSSPRQLIDQQAIDELKMYEELMKQYTGKKKGGAVKKAAGGAVKAAAKAAEKAAKPSAEQAAKLAALREKMVPRAELAKKIMEENLDKPLSEIEEGGLTKALQALPKKKGGKVKFTNSLDAMRLALKK